MLSKVTEVVQAKGNAGLDTSQKGKEIDGFSCALVVEPPRCADV